MAGPGPAVDNELVDDADLADLKAQLLDSGLSVADLVATAWASPPRSAVPTSAAAPTVRGSALSPARLAVNDPDDLERALGARGREQRFNEAQSGGKAVSLADLIVLGLPPRWRGGARRGRRRHRPFRPGRTDATEEQTDVESVGYLEPRAEGFRDYVRPARS